MRFPFPQTVNTTLALQPQKLTLFPGEVFSTEEWWAVDLLAICQVHLVRIVTDANYNPDEIGDLMIKVGEVTTPETTLNFISQV